MTAPNFVVIMADQFRADCIGALGNLDIVTPHLDKLAKQGRVFRNAFTPSPVCVPARAGFHYSLYPSRSGCKTNVDFFPDPQTPGFVSELAGHGYHTHAIGKCHFRPDPLAPRGFASRETQEEVVTDPANDDYLQYLRERGYRDLIDPHGIRGAHYYVPQQCQTLPGDHPTNWIGDRSVDFVSSHASSADPFLLFASFIHPHPPFILPAPWYRLYDPQTMPVPFRSPYEADLLTAVNRLQMRRKQAVGLADSPLMSLIRSYYYGCVSMVDYQIGRIMRAVESIPGTRETVFVFFSDHGEYLGDFGCFGKRGMHRVVTNVPLLIADPANHSEQVDLAASLVDIGPTLLARAGILSAHEFDGIDLLSAELPASRRVFSQYGGADAGLYMVSDGRFRYVYSTFERAEFLFEDRGFHETGNLAAETAMQVRMEEFRQVMLDYDPTLKIDPAPPGFSRPDEEFEELNSDLGPVTDLQPWAEVEIPSGDD